MKKLFSFFALFLLGKTLLAQNTVCPAPAPGSATCYQTSRPTNGNPLTNWPPIPIQDCCNARLICNSFNLIQNGVLIPQGSSPGILYPGCVQNELPSDANTCFSNNEKATTWYKFQVQPLPGGPTAVGAKAGKLRFKIIPLDVYDDPDYDIAAADDGTTGYGATDYDFLLFRFNPDQDDPESLCNNIRLSPAFGVAGSSIAACNWTGTRGPTGLYEPGTGTSAAVLPATRFNKPIDVNVGDIFYLAIDNFSVNSQGFELDFREGPGAGDSTAFITFPAPATLAIKEIVNANCQDSTFTVKFTSPVICDSVLIDRFSAYTSSGPIAVLDVRPYQGCNILRIDSVFTLKLARFEVDSSLRIQLVQPVRDACGTLVNTGTFPVRFAGMPEPWPQMTFTNTFNVLAANIPNATAWQWYKDGVAISGATSSSYTITESGIYQFEATLPGGCKVRGQASNQVFSGTETLQSQVPIQLYPNPAQHKLSISWSGSVQQLRIFSLWGQEILSQKVTEGQTQLELNLDPLPKGSYIVELQSRSGAKGRKKLMHE